MASVYTPVKSENGRSWICVWSVDYNSITFPRVEIDKWRKWERMMMVFLESGKSKNFFPSPLFPWTKYGMTIVKCNGMECVVMWCECNWMQCKVNYIYSLCFLFTGVDVESLYFTLIQWEILWVVTPTKRKSNWEHYISIYYINILLTRKETPSPAFSTLALRSTQYFIYTSLVKTG